ncbi:hypothetical protein RHGRI_025525 [Rhododendron griersonianum]|uniref:Beta-glucosidase n=1 Tax=Rhododendron griersonianum TaxID=479676 RepID=A0AAV6IST5_9ERIC|nr:hypothetical protein RHGRI_025525 [Rhododendron griersonianum]
MCLCWAATAEAEYEKYKDPKQHINVRIKDLMGRMTLEEKIGQMTQIERTVASAEVIKKYHIGLAHEVINISSSSDDSLTESERRFIDTLKGVRLPKIGFSAEEWLTPLGQDYIFEPEGPGLNAPLQIREPTEAEMSRRNIPRPSIPTKSANPARGRGAEQQQQQQKKQRLSDEVPPLRSVLSGGGSVPAVKASAGTWIEMVNSFQKGALSTSLQIPIIYGMDAVHGNNNVYKATIFPHNIGLGATRQAYINMKKVAACAKHYVGDGGTTDGINANNTEISWKGLLSIHMPAYANAVAKGVSTVMISFSSWNGVKMHSNRKLITGYLKNTLRFNGFVISDWQGIDQLTNPPDANYTYSVLTGIGTGIDMIMVPYNYTQFIDVLTSLVKKEFIPMTRIDDAVKRILRVKFTAGLFESPNGDYSFVNYLGCQVRAQRIGKGSCEEISCIAEEWDHSSYCHKNTVDPTTEVVYNEDPDPSFVETGEFSYAIVVVGEHTYAETAGDSFNLTIPDPGPSIITNVCGTVECVVVLITGRPVVIQQYVGAMDALVAAWLPGTEGQGVADVLFGDYGFTGKLSRTWFKTVDQLPMNVGDPHYDPLFPFGFGLTTKPTKEP